MEFRGRGTQNTQNVQSSSVGSVPVVSSASAGSSAGGRSNFQPGSQSGKLKRMSGSKSGRLAIVGLLFSVTAILVALTFLIFNSGDSQNRLVIKKQYQAVFLNNGQVYFGRIKDVNTSHTNLQDIFYLQTSGGANGAAPSPNTDTSSNNVSLVKLGCELHAPIDQMIINNEQVIFWENIQDSSQVVKAISKFKADNPKGQTCNASNQTSTQQAAPNAAPPTAPVAPTTTTPVTPRRP